MKKQTSILLTLLAVIFIFTMHIADGQNVSKPFFTVEGEVQRSLKLTQEDLLKLKQKEIKTKDKEGKEHTFKGVPLAAVLDSAGVTLGKQLRGEHLAKYLLIKAADGYEVIFSLPETDPEFTDQVILLAYFVDGKPLEKGDGPFRIIVPNDKRAARWIREVRSIKVMFSKE